MKVARTIVALRALAIETSTEIRSTRGCPNKHNANEWKRWMGDMRIAQEPWQCAQGTRKTRQKKTMRETRRQFKTRSAQRPWKQTLVNFDFASTTREAKATWRWEATHHGVRAESAHSFERPRGQRRRETRLDSSLPVAAPAE
jgi:hypothetical protein